MAGGNGFLGSELTNALQAAGHETWWLTRGEVAFSRVITWDGQTQGAWSGRIAEMDAVVNVTGHSLAHWPWSAAQKQRFIDSRVKPARALAAAVLHSRSKPKIFVQTSGINYYGLAGANAADESSPPGDDFLAHLSVEWEKASQEVEAAGVRRIVTRNAVILSPAQGMLPIMALPMRLFVGGRLGEGRQAMNWIHVADYVDAVLFLLENSAASGPYNLVAPTPTSSDQFGRALAAALHRPYWIPAPSVMLRMVLGEMSVLVTTGRYTRPQGLEALGFHFRFPRVESAFGDLYGGRPSGPTRH